MSSDAGYSITEAGYGPLRQHADAWSQLPAPPETFLWQDVPEGFRDTFRALSRTAAVDKVERVTRSEAIDGVGPGDTKRIYRYRWQKRAWETITQQIETQYSPCPCGHAGVQNHGDHYTCSFEGCEQQFDRDELEVDT